MALYVKKKMGVLTFIWFTSHVDKNNIFVYKFYKNN